MADKSTVQVDTYKEELFENFYSKLPDSFKPTEIYTQIRAAYDFAYKAHYGVTRKGGTHEPYITHPVSVALIVANEIGLGVSSVVAALLHDVVEDTEYTRDDIKEMFGENVANIVEGLTKITNVYDAKANTQAETFKKMLLSIPHDSRVAFIKIADRLHNMRTMDDMPDGTRQIKAGENLYVYVPIADQLGLYDIKNELEDSSFKYAHPGRYAEIKKLVDDSAEERQQLLFNFRMSLMRVLVQTNHVCKLAIVNKSFYQIWSMMQETGKTFSEIENFQTVRIIFDPQNIDSPQDIVSAHYNIYATVINNFPEKSDSKRDYVITPKKNGFKALVFQVMFEGNWIEIQILTSDDDMIAHRGYCYNLPNRKGLDILREKVQDLDKSQDAVELINRFRSLSSMVTIFVFTPKGSIVELPQGSTVLDFAFAIHSRMGCHCLGAYVGQKIVPINYELKTTDQVTVLTSPSAKPSSDWFGYVKSDHAKFCLEKYFKHKVKSDKSDVIKGRQDFNKLLRDNRVIPNLLLSGKILSYYKLPNNEELYKRLARQEISMDDLWACIKRLRTIIDGAHVQRRKEGENVVAKVEKNKYIEIDYKKPLLIEKSMPYVLSSCCYPISGDDALAYTDEDGVLYIHKRECENAKKLTAINGKKTTKVLWSDDLEPSLASINIQGTDRFGLIRDIAVVLTENNVSIKTVEINEEDGVFAGKLLIYVKDVNELERVIKILHDIQGVVKVNRINNKGGRVIAAN